MVEVTEEEVKNSVKLIPSWTTVVRGGREDSLVLTVCDYCPGLALLLFFEGTVGHQVHQLRGCGSLALLESNGERSPCSVVAEKAW